MYPFDHSDVLSNYSNPTLIKRGGQKVVYRAIDSSHGEIVLKIGQYSSPQSLERIRREVAVLSDIDSDYYPKNFDFRVLSDQRFLIIEEYVNARPLGDCLSKFREPGSIIDFLTELITGLQIIWEKRIVHRDLKPDNILVRPDGSIKIIDLGIARLLDLESLTRTLAMRGPCTPIYAAPEQLSNRKTEIDIRTDQFNLGILAAQLSLEGQHPFDPNLVGGASTVENIVRGNWARSHVAACTSVELAAIVTKLLGAEPYQRYRKPIVLLAGLKQAKEAL